MLIKALSEFQQKSKESQVIYQNGIFITITRNIIKMLMAKNSVISRAQGVSHVIYIIVDSSLNKA